MTTRRKVLGGMAAMAACGPLAAKARAGGGPSSDEPSIVLLELSRTCDVGDGQATVRARRRFVRVDLDDEDDLGDLNETFDGVNGILGLGNDEDGYWKVERAFGPADPRAGEDPAWREMPLPAFRAALHRWVGRHAG